VGGDVAHGGSEFHWKWTGFPVGAVELEEGGGGLGELGGELSCPSGEKSSLTELGFREVLPGIII